MARPRVTSKFGNRQRRAPQPLRRTEWRYLRLAIAVALVAVTGWAYSTSFRGVFLEGDDQDSIVRNPHVRALWPPAVPLSAPADTTLAGRPVASLTFALNYVAAPVRARDAWSPESETHPPEAFFENVWGYHAVNLAIHLLAGLVLFGVVRRSLEAPALRDRVGEASTLLAAAVAGLWLVHPLQTESVTYLVQRVESLMGLFYLLTIYCSIRAAEHDFADHRWTAAAVLACLLGLGAKEAAATAPFMALAWVWILWPQPKLRAGLPLFGGLAATWLVLAWQIVAAPRGGSVGLYVDGWTPWLYLQTQAGVLLQYLRLTFWPHPLVLEYAWRPPASLGAALPAMLVLALLAAATVVGVIRRRPVALAGLWFFLILAPTSSLLPIATEVAAEHRMYLPLAGVVALVVVAGFMAARRLRPAQSVTPMVVAASAVLMLALAATTYARNRDYWSVQAMVGSIVAGRPQNAHAQLAVAVHAIRAGQFAQAESGLRRALDLPLPFGQDDRQIRAQMHMYLGSSLSAQGKIAEGTPHLERALALDPGLTETYGLLGENYLGQGRAAEAVRSFDRAIEKLRDVPPLLTRAAWVLATSSRAEVRDGAKAVGYAERATTLTRGRDPHTLATLAAAYAETGQFDRAVATVNQAIAVAASPGQAGVLSELRGYLASFSAHRPLRSTAW
jgi:tetratricopeptide (TPR) repeat protein